MAIPNIPANNINLAIIALSDQIAAIALERKPTYKIDGQEVDWAEYIKILTDQMEKLITIRQQLNIPYQRITRIASL